MAIASIAEAQAAYVANGGYASTHVVAEATAFAEACRYLIMFMPKRASRESESADFNVEGITAALAMCNDWLRANGAPSPNAVTKWRTVTVGDFRR